MARFVGCEFKEVDPSLLKLSGMGYIRYKKIKGKYDFMFFPRPIDITIFIPSKPIQEEGSKRNPFGIN